MLLEALWRWLHEDVTCQHCPASLDASVAGFKGRTNEDPVALADRLALKLQTASAVEKLRIPK